MEKRAHGEPGQEAGVLDRIPGPVAAPSELDVGPPHSQGDPGRQEEPGKQGPAPDCVDPSSIDSAGHQRGDREGKRNGDADVAEVEERRVDDHPGILELRIESVAVGRGEGEPFERVGAPRQQHHGQEEQDDCASDASDGRQEHGVPATGDGLRNRSKTRQDQGPKQQRSLLARPQRGKDVVVGQVSRGVRRDVLDIEVVREEGLPERHRRYPEDDRDRVARPFDDDPGVGTLAPTGNEGEGCHVDREQECHPERKLTQECHGLASLRKLSSRFWWPVYSGRVRAIWAG